MKSKAPKAPKGVADLYIPPEKRLIDVRLHLAGVQKRIQTRTKRLSADLKRAAELNLILSQLEQEISEKKTRNFLG